MPRIEIDINDDQLHTLNQMAEEQGRSLPALLQQAIDQFIVHPFSQEDWLQEFRLYVERIRADIPDDATPEELELDIAAARDEVRQLRRATRRY